MDEIYPNISLNKLRNILKEEVKKISLADLQDLSDYFQTETRFLPDSYKSEYIQSVQNVLLSRLIILKNDSANYKGTLESNDVKIINELLSNENNVVSYVMNISIIYARYFLKEPIHNINSVFPGHKKVYKKGKYYYCPVKKYHITNNESVCKYCIAKIEED